jgi:hypothetical protein
MARPRKEPGARATARPRSDFEDQPDRRKVTARQAAYLEELSGVSADKLVAKPIGQLEELLRWKIDPHLLFFRKVCGRVVRVEPGTGIIQGVPNATVHVEDTDCSFLGFFPVEGPFFWWWWWFWPIFCHREEIATTMTDECGRFCVWIPRWDIDRILRFRLERVCFPDFVKPSLADFLKEIGPGPFEQPPIKVDPNPPDPAPFVLPEREVLEQAGAILGRGSLERLAQFGQRRGFGEQTAELHALLDEPAFLEDFHPPLTDEALKRVEEISLPEPEHEQKGRKAETFELAELSPAKAIGPFLRCRDVIVAEWEYIFDVPDITFRVTQDVDLDGDEETIYSEGFFDVRWNAGTIPPVTLKASPIARPSPFCDGPVIPCGNKPAIVTVGLMPLATSHHDNASGCATRVNRPKPAGLFSSPPTPGAGPESAQSPYAGTLQLHGCHRIGGAKYYRLLYKYEGGPELPFLGLDFYPPRLTGPPWWTHAVPDSQGWYEVLDPESVYVFPHWLIDWRTWNGSFPNGNYEIRLQLADASKTPLAPPAEFSDPVTIRIDNRSPSANFDQVRWRVTGGPWVETFTWPFACIVIHRPKNKDIEIEVSWSAWAPQFRSASVGASGCGAGAPALASSIGTAEHWHQNIGDNFMSRSTLWSLPHTLPQGSYGFTIHSSSRAFNPAGDGGGPGTNWKTDYDYLYVVPSIGVAVIDS